LFGLLVLLAPALLALSACAPEAVESAPQEEPGILSSCQDGEQASGAVYRICMPESSPWNGDLLVYAHGYVAYDRPVEIPEDQLVVGGVYIPELITSLGYAFATSSYSTNGLAMRDGVADLVDLVDLFTAAHGSPGRTYLAGPSEGGIITVLALEKHPDLFDGGLAACGPVGGLPAQTNYMGDYRVLFDYYFPGLLPGEAITIPQELIDNWDTHYATVVYPTISAPSSAYSMTQLLAVTGAAYDPADPATAFTTTQGLLWYSVFATNDAKAKLGGQPYDNVERTYGGSDDDAALNDGVRRYNADRVALEAMEADYQTYGHLNRPLVTVHTTLDEIIPYWHEPLYAGKVAAHNRTELHHNTAISRYGHCHFTPGEVMEAFARLVDMVDRQRSQHRVYLPAVFRSSSRPETETWGRVRFLSVE
jgi:pimeloyl-ACP methyl ester carboxylesterase